MTHQQANRLAAFCREHSMPARVERISWSGAYVVRSAVPCTVVATGKHTWELSGPLTTARAVLEWLGY